MVTRKQKIFSVSLGVILFGVILGGLAFSTGLFEVVMPGWNRVGDGVGGSFTWLWGSCSISTKRVNGYWIKLPTGAGTEGIYLRCGKKATAPVTLPVVTSTPTLRPSSTPISSAHLSSVYNIQVLSIKYFPPNSSDPTRIDRDVAGTDLPEGMSIDQLRQNIANVTQLAIDYLDRGGAYHGYKDSSSRSVFNYSIYEEKEFLKPIPIEPGTGTRPADHMKILQGEGFDICDYVENKGVKEVWLWMYHSNVAYPVESFQRGPNGGVGNGYMNLPLCKKTYTVYDYNYGRGVGEAVEDHTHHMESLFRSIDSYTWDSLFVGQWGQKDFYRCGWTHCPPNTLQPPFECHWPPMVHNYDWSNEASVMSDCEDWRKEGGGEKKMVNCHAWAGSVCGNDSGDKFKIWWMQNIPSSWYIYVGDFDRAKSINAPLN